MFKSALTFRIVVATFLFSAWLNVVHGYEHDDHEHHSEECEICVLLAGLTDYHVNDSTSKVDQPLVEEHYLFTVKDSLSTVIRFTNPRAPPHIPSHTNNLI